MSGLRATVGNDGALAVFGRRYWCEGTVPLAGLEVELRFPLGLDEDPQVWRADQYCCTPSPIAETGLNDPAAATMAAERWKAFRQRIQEGVDAEREQVAADHELVVRRRADLLLQLIDQRSKRLGLVYALPGFRGLAHALRYLKHFLGRAQHSAFEQPQHGELELADDEDVDLQLALMICDHSNALLERHFHGENPAGGDSRRVTEAAGASSLGRGGEA